VAVEDDTRTDAGGTDVAHVEAADAELLSALAGYATYLLPCAHLRANRLSPPSDLAAPGASGARDFHVLDAIGEPGAAYSQQDLADRLGINRTTMVKLIDRLEWAGLVVRARNPLDRRSYVLALTDDGRGAAKALEPAIAAGDDRLTAALTPAERDRFDVLLATLVCRPRPSGGQRRTSSLLAEAAYFVRRRFDDALSGTGLKARHFGVLTALAGGPCSQQLLARRLGLSEQGILQIVDEVEAAGLVVRDRDPKDRRRYALRTTPAGRHALGAARRVVEAAEQELAASLGADGRAELTALLIKSLRADT
jgi:DNA-binding MarR family transcriptional regulator